MRLVGVGVALLLPACHGDERAVRARALVSRFEQALRAGDRATLRQVVTCASRSAVDALPLEACASKAPLVVLDAVARPDGLHVRVRDPNQAGQAGAFVVVQENGELRVDLVASAGLTAREVPLPGPATRIVSRPLSPAERERAARLAR